MTSSRETTNPGRHEPLSAGMSAKPVAGASASSVLLLALPNRGIRAVAVQLVELMLDWRERRRQRRRLATMDEHMLRDIGLSTADVEHEVHKPFWRL
ncbi:MAG TPA: DUF1127 domain-containing protein [Dongiaceae bacterium]|nr:DUF1127 domain-containing protein [Dongiaceae bacterium]